MNERCMLLLVVIVSGCGSSANAPCETAKNCGTRTYQFCNDGASCSYATSDGSRFVCSSCGECSVAGQQLATWCDGPNDDAQCKSATPCINCCDAHHPNGFAIITQLVRDCICKGQCPTCSGTEACGGAAKTPDACFQCLGTQRACVVETESKCSADPICKAYQQCKTSQCP